MKYALYTIGKTDEKYLQAGIEIYRSKLKHYCQLQYEEIKGKKLSDPQQQKDLHARLLLAKIEPSDRVILLDERGKSYTSLELSKRLDKWQMSGARRIVLLIGGPYGHHQKLYDRVDEQLCLSKFTFTHDMSRLILLEQMYRAMSILRNEPYHNS